jgi:hypothetical protein
MPKMFDSQDFQPVDAHEVLGVSPSTQQVRTFPAFTESLSYEQLADTLTAFFNGELEVKPISKATLKNKWLSKEGRITRIYEGLEAPALKTESGRVTPFGISAVSEFVLDVHLGSKPYVDYASEVRSRFPVEPTQTVEHPTESSAITLSRGSTLDTFQAPEIPILPTFKHSSTESYVTNALAQIDQILEGSAEYDEAIDAELLMQAAARGAKRGAILAQVEIAATESARRKAVENMAKKQGLEEV